jgi:hypothetical protein
MRWVICSFKPQVNRMKTDRVMAGKAYSKHRGSAQDSACDETRSSGVCSVQRIWSLCPEGCGVVVGAKSLARGTRQQC